MLFTFNEEKVLWGQLSTNIKLLSHINKQYAMCKNCSAMLNWYTCYLAWMNKTIEFNSKMLMCKQKLCWMYDICRSSLTMARWWFHPHNLNLDFPRFKYEFKTDFHSYRVHKWNIYTNCYIISKKMTRIAYYWLLNLIFKQEKIPL